MTRQRVEEMENEIKNLKRRIWILEGLVDWDNHQYAASMLDMYPKHIPYTAHSYIDRHDNRITEFTKKDPGQKPWEWSSWRMEEKREHINDQTAT